MVKNRNLLASLNLKQPLTNLQRHSWKSTFNLFGQAELSVSVKAYERFYVFSRGQKIIHTKV